MTDAWEVPAQDLIPKVAEQLKGKIGHPVWMPYVRTGVHTERAPAQADWWYLRCASVMRKLHHLGPIGVSRLAAEYGGKKDNGSAPYHAAKGSRSVIQEALHELEKAGLVTKRSSKGRVLSPKGQSLLQKAAKDVMSSLVARNPALQKYL
jgi:small subunit ribosomal protein S19e